MMMMMMMIIQQYKRELSLYCFKTSGFECIIDTHRSRMVYWCSILGCFIHILVLPLSVIINNPGLTSGFFFVFSQMELPIFVIFLHIKICAT